MNYICKLGACYSDLKHSDSRDAYQEAREWRDKTGIEARVYKLVEVAVYPTNERRYNEEESRR